MLFDSKQHCSCSLRLHRAATMSDSYRLNILPIGQLQTPWACSSSIFILTGVCLEEYSIVCCSKTLWMFTHSMDFLLLQLCEDVKNIFTACFHIVSLIILSTTYQKKNLNYLFSSKLTKTKITKKRESSHFEGLNQQMADYVCFGNNLQFSNKPHQFYCPNFIHSTQLPDPPFFCFNSCINARHECKHTRCFFWNSSVPRDKTMPI